MIVSIRTLDKFANSREYIMLDLLYTWTRVDRLWIYPGEPDTRETVMTVTASDVWDRVCQ